MNAPPRQLYEFGGFRMDAEARVVVRADGSPVPLTPRVFDTLRYLVEHSGRVLDKEMLMEAVWPDCIVEENNLAQNISTLRRVFGETPGSQRYIVTVPGRGYRFAAEVKSHAAQECAEPDAQVEVPVASPEAQYISLPQSSLALKRSLRPLLLATAAVVAIALSAIVLWRLATQTSTKSSLARKVSKPNELSPSPITAASIAVLPFSNLSDEKENGFFADGMQEDILTALAKVVALKVIARTSVASYTPGPNRNLREIGQQLGVANILEGSVRRAGGKVRVTAQLIDTRTNTHLWAETYDRELADVFAIQSDIAQRIAAALEAKLAPEEKARLDERPTPNPEAYALYLTGRGRAGTVNGSTEDEIAAEQLYVQAIALDPGFALAYARASLLNSGVSATGLGPDLGRKAKALAQAREALRLAPTLSEAHLALGLCLYWGEKKYDEALKEFRLAAATSPNNAEIDVYSAGIYRRQGRWRDSIAAFERALSLDPRSRPVAILAGNNYTYVRDWPAAALCYKRVLEISPDSVYAQLGLAYLEVVRNDDPAAAQRIVARIPAGLDPSEPMTLARWDLAMLARDYVAAEKVLAEPQAEATRDATKIPTAFYLGRTALARGDSQTAERHFADALPAMERLVRDGSSSAEAHANLALLYAYSRRDDDAVREATRAVDLEPEKEDAFHGALLASNLALVYALTGKPDQALPIIEHLLVTPGAVMFGDTLGSVTLAELRLRWEWDGLRSDPRFQKILAAPEPKTNL